MSNPSDHDPSNEQAETLALALCRAVHARAKGQPTPYWVDVEELRRELEIAPEAPIDRSMLFACLRGWLQMDGEPAGSIALTDSGAHWVEEKAGT
jgi:hypothetical protein